LRVMDFVVESVGFEYDAQEDAVVIRPRQGPGFGLETDFYPVSRSTLIRLTGIHEAALSEPADGLVDPFAPQETRPEDQRRDTERSLKSFLQRAGVPFEGVEGADLAMADGQLIVTQTPRNHEKIRQLLRRYREVKQVEIEARFIEVQERNLRELGLEWTLVSGDGDFRFGTNERDLATAFTIGQDERELVIDREGLNLPRIPQGAPVLPVTVDLAEEAGNLLHYGGTLGELDVEAVIRALERQSGNDLLSAPKLTVLSGKTAEIVVAEEFRYPEMYGDTNAEVGRGDSNSGSAGVAITAGTPRSFTTRNVGVEMEVTPNVEENNSISLRLKPKVTEFEGFVEYGGTSVAIASDTTVTVPSGFFQPVFSVRRVDTEVTIWDGATVVMGGLTREHAVRVNDKVPLLGDLPLLGRLFRSEGESTQKRNLLIFVTANLVSPGGSPAFQYLPGVEPNSLYQAPLLSTPAGLSGRGE
jgi:general secretion pathway protein D